MLGRVGALLNLTRESLNPLGLDRELLCFSLGYMDESYDGAKQKLIRVFLSVQRENWAEMGRAWKLQLGAVRKRLAKKLRRLISRYHVGMQWVP